MPFDLGYPSHQANSARPNSKGFSLQRFYSMFPDEEACLRHVLSARFGENTCDSCQMAGPWVRMRGSKCFRHTCRAVRSPLTGSLFHQTNLPVHLWLYAMLHFANSATSVSTSFLQRHIGIGIRASLHMGERIRLHLAALDEDQRIGSAADEALVRIVPLRRVIAPGLRPNLAQVLVIGDGTRVSTAVVPRPRRHRLRAVLADKIDSNARVITDCYQTFRALSDYERRKPLAEFVPEGFRADQRRGVTIDGFIASLRHGLATQHIHVYEQNAWKYLKEYEFRYNRRFHSDETFLDMTRRFPILSNTRINALRRASFIER